jgi:ATP-dependent DNA helicase DinG
LVKLQNALSIKKTHMVQRLNAAYGDLDKHICQVHRFTNPKGGASQDDYLILRETNKGHTTISLKPLRIDAQAQSILYSRARIRVLMSATILDRDIFAESVGISRDERAQTAFISIPTPFKHSSFGLIFKPVGKMSKNKIDANIGPLIKEIEHILAEHPTEKGIIHTSTYAITRALEQIKDQRLLIQRSAADREKMLDIHIRSKNPTVLVSPAMMEGLDLVDDLGRFQVICKVPYPYIGDPVISKKMHSNPKWYAWCTVRTIVQAAGRCVRSRNDWSRTYILDECFGDLLTRWHTMFPEHFNELEIR